MVFGTMKSFTTKIDLLRRMLHAYVEPGPEVIALAALFDKAQELNVERNANVHAGWGAGRNPGQLTRFFESVPNNPKRRMREPDDITAENIQNVVDRISTLTAAIVNFEMHALPKLVVLRRPRE